ncbi:hypothetical protein J5X84_25235 [Streptosporangiaceae bacterium NEAU-GS5]|nr:hypothetical protein [Streptosporangiaceae bacterium NEAU-GS5]
MVLVFCFAVGVVSALIHIWWLTGLAVLAALATAADIWRVVRRRPTDDAS